MTTWVGIDVAKDIHWICALDGGGRILLSRAVKNTQAEIDALSAELRALPGPVTIGLDVDGSIATFLQAVLLADGLALVHVPGLAVNRASHGYAGGERKSDPQDARVIADLVRTREGLRPIRPDDDATATLRLLVSRRRDLVQDQNRRFSRLRQLLSQAHPALEAALEVTCKGALVLLTRYVTPGELRAASEKAVVRHLRRTSHLRNVEQLAATARACAAEQRIAVPGEATSPGWSRRPPPTLWSPANGWRFSTKSWRRSSPSTLRAPSCDPCRAWGPCSPPSSSPRPATSPASARPPRSPPQPASPPCCASRAIPGRSDAPGAATETSSASFTRAPSPPSPATPRAGPTATASGGRGASRPGRHRPGPSAHQRALGHDRARHPV